MAYRAKGQNVIVRIVVGGEEQSALEFVNSASITFNTGIIDEDYLGEKTTRHAATFNGLSGQLECNIGSADYLKFIDAYVQKARDQVSNTAFDLRMTLELDGSSPTITLPDCVFGEMDINASDRKDFVKSSIPFSASTYILVTE